VDYNGPAGWGTPDGVAGFAEASTANPVTVLNPGNLDTADGVPVTMAVQAVDSASGTLTYSAAGLPAGLAINPTTGLISGTDTAAAGSASVTVTVTDGTASGAVTFSIVTVPSMRTGYHAAAGPVRLGLGGKCLDDKGNSAANGNKIQIWACNGGAAQQWAFQPDGTPGGAGIVSINGKCLDIVHAGITNGSKIDLWPCTSPGANQQWLLNGFGLLVNPASGKCLDDTANSTKNGTQVQIYTCNGGPNQTWTLTGSPIQAGVPGKCLDDTANGTADGTKIQIYTCNGGPAQKWVLAADGTLEIHGKCLDVDGGFSQVGTLDGSKLLLETCNGAPDQVWLVGLDGELINGLSSRCLDDPAGSTVNGTAADQQDCYRAAAEVWAAT
jgi:beta-glucosidase